MGSKTFIYGLNLQNSLKNLTVMISNICQKTIDDCIETINVIIKKEHLYNVENVNLLAVFDIENDITIDRYFQMLIDNIQILKHQFKCLNVGICVHQLQAEKNRKIQKNNNENKNKNLSAIDVANNHFAVVFSSDDIQTRRYYTFKWDAKIDEKFLLDVKHKLLDKEEKNNEKNKVSGDKSEKEEFEWLLKEWVAYPIEELEQELLFTKPVTMFLQYRIPLG